MPVRFSISESGRGEELEHNLIALSYRIFDLDPIARIAKEIMIRQNRDGARLGIDIYGEPYDKLAESTWRTRGGAGPPLAPQLDQSRIVSDFDVVIEHGFDAATIRGRWPNSPWIRFHVTGAPKNNMPVRNPVGMRPHAWEQLRDEFHEWVQRVLRGEDRGGPAAPPTTGGGGGVAPSGGGAGPLAPTAANRPQAAPGRSPLAPTAHNGPGIERHGTDADDDKPWNLELRDDLPSSPAPKSGPGGGPEYLYGTPYYPRSGGGVEPVRAAIRKAIGSDATPRQVAALVGAPADATHVYVNESLVSGRGSGIDVEVRAPGLTTMRRTIVAEPGASRATTIYNQEIGVRSELQGRGIGTRIFADQVEAAAAAGFRKIETHAARELGLFNGYSTWPKLGYDAAIPKVVRAKLPAEMAGARRVSDLMATPEGRKFWDEHGIGTDMTFDLAPGSYSRRTLDAYLKAKGMR